MRQHAAPLLLGSAGAIRLQQLSLGYGPDQVSEAELQNLLHQHPECLPIAEIDPIFRDAVPICMELNTRVGQIDNFMVTPSGLPVLVECKLWRNPEGRREVVGQILDYAKELARWTASDLQREVARRVPCDGNPLLHILGKAGHIVDEITFNDNLTHNLRRGRFLLLIVGDGIREGVEAIAEYLQTHAGLHFSLGLIELPIFLTPNGERFVVPRVMARTELITRTVVAAPEGQIVRDEDPQEAVEAEDETLGRTRFWTDFLNGLHFDDPEQPKPRASRQGYLNVMLPVPAGNCWLTVYRNEARSKVGVYLSYTRASIGARVVEMVVNDWPAIKDELGGSVVLSEDKLGRSLIEDNLITGPWVDVSERDRAMVWLRMRTNDFVNVLRPRVKSALADLNGAR